MLYFPNNEYEKRSDAFIFQVESLFCFMTIFGHMLPGWHSRSSLTWYMRLYQICHILPIFLLQNVCPGIILNFKNFFWCPVVYFAIGGFNQSLFSLVYIILKSLDCSINAILIDGESLYPLLFLLHRVYECHLETKAILLLLLLLFNFQLSISYHLSPGLYPKS